ncbi:hypothetical protein BC832DRAFT_536510 [Gaertneriomyces semiglobifer]|nr:hypothetical protein BC832DRAFT_536510 [Gaertneriomyces semiglobifer]
MATETPTSREELDIKYGVQVFGIDDPEAENLLVEKGLDRLTFAAEALADKEAKTIKFYLGNNYGYYYGIQCLQANCGKVHKKDDLVHKLSLAELVTSEPYKSLFEMKNFTDYVFWVQPVTNHLKCKNDPCMCLDGEKKAIEELCEALLKLDKKKKFFIGHWEGDGMVEAEGNPRKGDPHKIARMISWLKCRQEVVDEVRKGGAENIYHYSEFNWIGNDAPMLTKVYPALMGLGITLNYISYSCYSAIKTKDDFICSSQTIANNIKEVIERLEGYTKGFMIGEYYYPRFKKNIPNPQIYYDAKDEISRYQAIHNFKKAIQKLIMPAGLSKIVYVFYWQFYNNMAKKDKTLRKFGIFGKSGISRELLKMVITSPEEDGYQDNHDTSTDCESGMDAAEQWS